MGNSSTASSYGKILFLNISFLFIFLLFISHPLLLQQSPKPNITKRNKLQSSDQEEPCDLRDIETSEAKCDFLLSSSQCSPQGYINYLRLFYCVCGDRRPLGLAVLLLWLILLFYLLGSTAATYFCSTLEGLSGVLGLSPAVAGTTLLSLGNGAPDVFSSIASFEGATASGVGINSILGGALFVSTVVVGVVSVCVAPRGVAVDSLSFIRDACFLILVLVALTAILLAGKISVWVAMAFALLYLVYVFLVYITSVFGGILKNEEGGKQEEKLALHDLEDQTKEELEAPLLGAVMKLDKKPKKGICSLRIIGRRIVHLLELPLYLPRRLTIPDICEDRWSKPFAVISAALSPLLLATLCGSTKAVLCGGLFGLLMGCAAFLSTEEERPPARFRLPWLAGGFIMSVTWTYVTAEELVSLLVSLGTILEISPALLGLTVLAWGDSLGDLIAATAMAVSGGAGGAQVAISGCYAGPTFNTLVGLGIPMALSSWPSPAAVSMDPSVFETLGFLAGALLWALVILPKRGMKPDRVLGGGLFVIYLGFLSLRLSQSLAAQFVLIKV